MVIGGTSMDAPAVAAASALKSSLDTQASLAGSVIGKSLDGNEMATQAAAEQGKGTRLDTVV